MKKLERRDIIKIAGGAIAGTAAGTLFSGAPFLSLQWLVEWTQDQYVPAAGEEKYLEGKCILCPNRCPVSVRMIGSRAVKIEAVGTGCFRVQNAIHLYYHPERIKYPLKRADKKGKNVFSPATWEEAIKDISSKIKALKDGGKGGAIAAIGGRDFTLSGEILKRMLKSVGSPHYYTEPGFDSISGAAAGILHNTRGSFKYDLENADYILSFGARLAEGWGDPAVMHRSLSALKARGAKYVHIDTLCTRSASYADRWIPVKPGTETILALGIIKQLIAAGKTSPGANFAQWVQVLINEYTPERITEITGVTAETIKQLAQDLMSARSPVAVAGKGGRSVSSSTVEFAAVQALNSITGSIGRKGGVMFAEYPGLGEPALDAAALEVYRKTTPRTGLDDFIKNGEVPELLFINESDPVFKSVYGKALADKMRKTPMVVAFMPLLNDTAAYADYVLPTICGLEDGNMGQRFKSMHPVDILLSIAKRVDGIKNSFPWKDHRDLLAIRLNPQPRAGGNIVYPVDHLRNYLAVFSKKIQDQSHPLALIPFEIPQVGDGDGLALPYVLKCLDGTTLTGKKLWVMMNPETAKKNGVSEGSRITIISKRGKIGSVKVHLTNTVAPDTVAIPLGFGHVSYTRYAEGKGVNPMTIMSDEIDPVSGAADWWFTRVKIS